MLPRTCSGMCSTLDETSPFESTCTLGSILPLHCKDNLALQRICTWLTQEHSPFRTKNMEKSRQVSFRCFMGRMGLPLVGDTAVLSKAAWSVKKIKPTKLGSRWTKGHIDVSNLGKSCARLISFRRSFSKILYIWLRYKHLYSRNI